MRLDERRPDREAAEALRRLDDVGMGGKGRRPGGLRVGRGGHRSRPPIPVRREGAGGRRRRR